MAPPSFAAMASKWLTLCRKSEKAASSRKLF